MILAMMVLAMAQTQATPAVSGKVQKASSSRPDADQRSRNDFHMSEFESLGFDPAVHGQLRDLPDLKADGRFNDRWVKINGSTDITALIRIRELQSFATAGMISMRIILHDSNAGEPASVLARDRVDCAAKTVTPVSALEFDAAGKIMETIDIPLSQQKVKHVGPDTLSNLEMRAVCIAP